MRVTETVKKFCFFPSTMANIRIKTWGCTANQDNEAIMAGFLLQEGHSLVKLDEEADLFIFNTCTVKGVTQNKIVDELQSLRKDFPEKKILISGCMAGAQEAFLKKLHPNASFVNTMHITKIPDAVERILHGEIVTLTKKRYENKANLPKLYLDKKIATIQISQGCADACYFCLTKLSQGFIKSFPLENIKAEVDNAVKKGIKTIYLTSQDNGAYGLDKEQQSQLVPLLKEIIDIPRDFKVRVGMANPRHLIPLQHELLEVYKNKKIMKFLHIPAQSGSNKVLKEMNRRHTVEEFKTLVQTFRKDIKNLTLSTDIICGYPTEEERDFQETLSFIKEIKPEVLNISKFAPRPKTKAAQMKQLPSQEIKRRTKILTELFQELKKD